MRSLLDTEIKGQREGRGRLESPKRAPCTKFKVGPNWDPSLAWVRREQKAAPDY